MLKMPMGHYQDLSVPLYMRLYFEHVHGAQFSIYIIYFIWFLSAVGGAVLLRNKSSVL